MASRLRHRYGNLGLDFAIPWKLVGIQPEAGKRFYFDMGIADADNDGERRGTLQLFEGSGLWQPEEGTDFQAVQLLGQRYSFTTPDPGDNG